ncbi:hypothetical protein HDC36_003334 [Xanthomonas sp. JAI131]|jgi:hypothetical protein|uniref:hypothetical protein n=1 Tax=Xanthomonas sp. JAI131 TaxID=2723067 RepID=UPI0015CA9DAA|nr:hypothetical protein [Xanthomonas sp. JAI131]NYF21858.1 hypothetical protein [Xanthomonas sp. JAI131]
MSALPYCAQALAFLGGKIGGAMGDAGCRKWLAGEGCGGHARGAPAIGMPEAQAPMKLCVPTQ